MTLIIQTLLLTLLSVFFGSPCKGQSVIPPKLKHRKHHSLATILPNRDGWMVLGTTSSTALGSRPTSWMITGPSPLICTKLPDDTHLRNAAILGDNRITAVGEVISRLESASLGHHEYRGIILTLSSSGEVLDRRVLGKPGATGFVGVTVLGGLTHAVGIQQVDRGWRGWWVGTDAERDLKLDVVTGIRTDTGGIAIFGQRGKTTLDHGKATILSYDSSGETRWTWQGPKHSRIADLHVRPGGGWIGVGQRDTKAWIFTLGSDGVLLSSHQSGISGSGEVIATHPTGVILVCGIQLTQFDPNIWCSLINLEGSLTQIIPMKKSDHLRRVSGLIPTQEGWWLAGTEQVLPEPVEGVVWRLNRTGRVQGEPVRLRAARDR